MQKKFCSELCVLIEHIAHHDVRKPHKCCDFLTYSFGKCYKNQETGFWKEWFVYENTKHSEGHYEHGKEIGLWIYWHSNGKKSAKGYYEQGLKTGKWTFWCYDGIKSSEEYYNNGRWMEKWKTNENYGVIN